MYKLIRDKYTNLINSSELSYIKDEDEHFELLQEKLAEELLELAVSKYTDVNEYADVIEVINSIARLKGVPLTEIESARKAKRDKFGGFMSGLILNRDE